MDISVVIPIYNEEENIIPLFKEIKQVFLNNFKNKKYEIIFINFLEMQKL